MYIEATGQNPNDTAEIMSDSYPSATAGHCFTLWYHMYGADVGTLNIFQVFGNKRYFLWGMKGDRGNVWKKTQITIKNSAQYTVSIILERPQRVHGKNIFSFCDRRNRTENFDREMFYL